LGFELGQLVPHDDLTGFSFAVAIPAVVEQDGDRAIAVQRGRFVFLDLSAAPTGSTTPAVSELVAN